MCLLTNIAAAELIPFCFGEIINDFNILECVVLAKSNFDTRLKR